MRAIARVSLAYLFISLAMTWPLLSNFNSGVPGGGGDATVYLWDYWWLKFSLLDLMQNPFYTDYILLPYRSGLTQHTLSILNSLISIPLQFVFGLVAVNNILIIGGIVLSGLGAYLLTDHFVKNPAASFISGLIYAFCPTRFYHLHISVGLIQWMPFYVLFLIKAMDSGGRWVRNAIIAGVFLGFNVLSDYYYFIAMALLTVIYLICFCTKDLWQNLKRVSLIVLVALPALAPILYYSIIGKLSGGRKADYPVSDTIYAADLLGFLSPSPDHFLLGRFSLMKHFTGDGTVVVYIGFSVLALVALGWIVNKAKDRAYYFIAGSALVFLLLSLGSYPRLLGKTLLRLPLPFEIFFAHTPFLNEVRCPYRFVVIAILLLSVLAAYGARRLFERNVRVAWLLLPLVLVEFSSIPIYVEEFKVPAYYGMIAKDKQADAILEVPFVIQDGQGPLGMREFAKTQFYQTAHAKKMPNGFLSRIDYVDYWSYLNLPLFRELLMFELSMNLNSETLAFDKPLNQEVVNLFGIDYIVIHKTTRMIGGRLIGASLMAQQYLGDSLQLHKVHEDGEAVVYRTERQSAERYIIDAGAGRSIPYLMSGWINGQQEDGVSFAFIEGTKAIALLNLMDADYDLTLRIKPVQTDNALTLSINNIRIDRVMMKEGWNIYKVRISKANVRKGINELRLTPEGAPLILTMPRDEWSGSSLASVIAGWGYGKEKVSDYKLNWETDNRKFRGASVYAAVDYVEVQKITK